MQVISQSGVSQSVHRPSLIMLLNDTTSPAHTVVLLLVAQLAGMMSAFASGHTDQICTPVLQVAPIGPWTESLHLGRHESRVASLLQCHIAE